ncbi:MAG: nucleoside 2-deoxyribosyltransferase [Holophagaceae bacterium]
MDLYLSCSLTGGRQDQPLVAALVARMEALGHRVLTAHLAAPDAMASDGGLSPDAVFERDAAWLRAARAVVAEVSTPSHGVGFEIAYALERGKPVLCLAREGVRVSKMLTGIRQPGFAFATYATPEAALARLEAFLTAP